MIFRKLALVVALVLATLGLSTGSAGAVNDTYHSYSHNGCTVSVSYSPSIITTNVSGSNCGGGWHSRLQRFSSETSAYCSGSVLRTNYSYGTQTYTTANHCYRVTIRIPKAGGGYVYSVDHLS